jgi:hypothetical protein
MAENESNEAMKRLMLQSKQRNLSNQAFKAS